MGRKKTKLPTTYDLYTIGEQIRTQLSAAGFIKDHRHLLRKYRNCFVAKDAIDWLVRMHHVDSRGDAVTAMSLLQEFNVIRHVSDEQEFKDKNTHFRFTRDDDSYQTDRELTSFYRGLEIYDKLKKTGGKIMREFYHKGELHTQAFYGSELVDFLVQSERDTDRQLMVGRLQDLQSRGILVHMTSDDYQFVDDRLIYEFGVDFYRPCLLNEVLEIMDKFNSLTVQQSLQSGSQLTPEDIESEEYEEDDEDLTSFVQVDSAGSIKPSKTKTFPGLTQGGSHSQPPLSSERNIQVYCDNVGYGLVLRGCAPCYVHCVDPLGPASKAKIKVGMAISSVNGQPVFHQGHQQVGLLVAQSEGEGAILNLGVTAHRRQRTAHS